MPLTGTASTSVADASLSLAGAFTFTATEGQASAVQQVATLTDAAGADSHIGDLSATINWGDSTSTAATLLATSTPGVYTVEGSHTYAEYGTYTIQVSASDVGGSSVPLTGTASTSVADASLSLAGPFTFTATEGQLSAVQQVATLTDAAGADSQIGDLSATINWGDNTTSAATLVATSTPGVYTVEGSHTYAEYGAYTIEVSASDKGGSSVPLTPTASTSVADASLSLAGPFTFTATEGQSSAVQQVATLTDAAGADSQIADLSATINWGDNTTSAATLVATGTAGVYTVEGSHTYAEYGAYTIEVSASDKGGSSVPLTGTASTTVADASLSLAGAFTFTATEGQASRGAAGGHADRRGRG